MTTGNKVYSFKPKGKGYTVYATKTYHGEPDSSNRSCQSRYFNGVDNILIGMLAKGIV